jgi:hypothetical protein
MTRAFGFHLPKMCVEVSRGLGQPARPRVHGDGEGDFIPSMGFIYPMTHGGAFGVARYRPELVYGHVRARDAKRPWLAECGVASCVGRNHSSKGSEGAACKLYGSVL